MSPADSSSAVPGPSPVLQAWAVLQTLVLGREPALRLQMRRTLAFAAVGGACLLLQWVAVLQGVGEVESSLWLSGWTLAGLSLAYGLQRGGWTRHWPDPWLTVPQLVLALSCLAWAYCLDATVRGALLAGPVLVVAFGAVTCSPVQTRLLALSAVGLFGLAMLLMGTMDPDRFPPGVEAVHFLMLSVGAGAVSLLAMPLHALRTRLAAREAELAQTSARARLLATRDELTGLYNRRYMLELLDMEVRRGRRHSTRLCLCLLDVDHFRRINEAYGHAAGDEVLRGVAQALSHGLRESDVVCRWDGEKFLLMLPGTSWPDTLRSVDRLRMRLSLLSLSDTHPELRITFSAGVAAYIDGEKIEQTLERADCALGQAKTSGRNRVMPSPHRESQGPAVSLAE